MGEFKKRSFEMDYWGDRVLHYTEIEEAKQELPKKICENYCKHCINIDGNYFCKFDFLKLPRIELCPKDWFVKWFED